MHNNLDQLTKTKYIFQEITYGKNQIKSTLYINLTSTWQSEEATQNKI